MTDWITALSTLATAVIAWLVYWHLRRREDPVVIAKFAWRVDPVMGRYIEAQVEIINRIDEPLVITSAAADRPRLASISQTMRGEGGAQPHAGMLRPGPPSKRPIALAWTLAAKGSFGTLIDRTDRADRIEQALYVFPPSTWDGGELLVTLRASTSSSAIKDRRLTIKYNMPTQASSTTLENASNVG